MEQEAKREHFAAEAKKAVFLNELKVRHEFQLNHTHMGEKFPPPMSSVSKPDGVYSEQVLVSVAWG